MPETRERPRHTELIAAHAPPELKQAAERAAAATERSLSAYLRHALRQQMRADERALGRLDDE